MRVIAGTARGRRLRAPEGLATRPTSDRVREAAFNALASMDAIAGAGVLDLFAGSGALGIEALSRGARHATFVEHAPEARRAVAANLADLGLDDRATVTADDAWTFLARAGDAFDLVLLDPPYAMDRWDDLAVAVAGRSTPDGVLVAEAGDEVELGAHWDVLRAKRYGGTVVQIARRSPRRDPPETPATGARP